MIGSWLHVYTSLLYEGQCLDVFDYCNALYIGLNQTALLNATGPKCGYTSFNWYPKRANFSNFSLNSLASYYSVDTFYMYLFYFYLGTHIHMSIFVGCHKI